MNSRKVNRIPVFVIVCCLITALYVSLGHLKGRKFKNSARIISAARYIEKGDNEGIYNDTSIVFKGAFLRYQEGNSGFLVVVSDSKMQLYEIKKVEEKSYSIELPGIGN